MASIIRHSSRDRIPALPDFRNLGTILRILLAVNGAAAVVALARTTAPDAFIETWVAMTGFIEPHLILQLAVLYAIAPWLLRQPGRVGVACVFASTVACGLAVHFALRQFLPGAQDTLLRHLLLALVATAVLIAYFRLRARALSPAITEARLQALQARIRPHFLFNTLNAVLSLIRKDARRAEAAIEDLAELYRMVMADTKNLTTLARELDLTRQYLNLEQLRLGERLIVDWQTAEAPRDALVPPLLLQPLVENAVYHGIEPGVEPGTIVIAIRRDRDRVHVKLTNPYHPEHQHRQGNRIALANIRERLALHFDVEGVLESGVKGSSYEIRMTMPYRRASPHSVSGERAAA